MLKPPFIFSVYVLVCYVYFYACIFMNFTRAYFKDITGAAWTWMPKIFKQVRHYT